MQNATPASSSTLAQLATMSTAELAERVRAQAATIAQLTHQLEWFKRQLFGAKSERLRVLENAQQLPLTDVLPTGRDAAAEAPGRGRAHATSPPPRRG